MTNKYIFGYILTSGIITPILVAFLGDTITIMVPWLIAMFTTVTADLAAGLWKSYRLNIPIRFSKACRETMGKLIVYFTIVIMACSIEVASGSDFRWGKWLSLFVILIEIGSMISNILKPHGINLSMSAFIKAILTHSALPFTFDCDNVDEMVVKENIEEIRKEELEKFNAERRWKEKKSSKS